jgi:regulator of sigma E protease
MPFALSATLSTLVVLGIMVLVHEFGHFLTAKLCGVRVEVFSIGFGQRLFGFKRGDTDYRISLLPLGGYVKMSGEQAGDGVPTSGAATDGEQPARTTPDPGDFTSHPRWQRILIGLSGPFANFVLAFLLMTGLYMMHNEVPIFYSQPAVVDYVVANSAAAKAGIQAGDKIVRFDSEENPTWEAVGNRAALDVNSTVPVTVERSGQLIHTSLAIQTPEHGEDFESKALGLLPQVQGTPLSVNTTPNSVEPTMPAAKAGLKPGDVIASVDGQRFTYVGSMLAYLQEAAGRPVSLTVQRGDRTLHLSVAPVLADDGTGHSAYRLGFVPHPLPYTVQQLSLPDAVRRSVMTNLQYSGYIVEVLHKLFTRRAAVQNLSGPIGIARETGEAISMPGWQPIIGLMALISLNLGIFNLLPIPILDGGMIVLLLIEGALRRDLNQEFKERVYQVAFVVLILFAAFVMFNDVTKLPIFSKLKP